MSEKKRSEIISSEVIHDALQFLDDEMIEEVESLRRGFDGLENLERMEEESYSYEPSQTLPIKIIKNKEHGRKRNQWRKWGTLAASICVLITGSFIYEAYIRPAEDSNLQLESSDSVQNISPENSNFGNLNLEDLNEGKLNQESANEESANKESVNEEISNAESLNQDNTNSETLNPEDSNAEKFHQEGADLAGVQTEQEGENEESDHATEEQMPSDEESEERKDDMSGFPETIETQTKGVWIPQMEVSLKKEEGVSSDMLGFFILNGRSYIQYEFQQDYKKSGADFVGRYAGKITGMINEWTEADGYVEGAGTYIGNVYEVKGISPEFMLCMVWEDGSVETFIHNNAITLYKGADLVDEWLDLRGNYDVVALERIADGRFVYKDMALTKEELDVFARFLDAFAKGDFVYVEEKMNHPIGGDMDTADVLDFYFIKENGVRLRFRTLGDGYVSFPWLDACVRIDRNVYDEVVAVLQQFGQ